MREREWMDIQDDDGRDSDINEDCTDTGCTDDSPIGGLQDRCLES